MTDIPKYLVEVNIKKLLTFNVELMIKFLYFTEVNIKLTSYIQKCLRNTKKLTK